MPPAAPTTTAPATSGQALQQMTQAQGQMQDPSAIMQGEQQNLGVPQAQQQVSGLRQAIANTTNLLNNVTPSVEGRTANSLVTSAQANRQIQNESAPIAKTLSDQTTKEAQSSSDLKDLMSQAGQNAQLKIQGQDQKLGFLKNVYDALFNKEQSAADAKMKQDQFNATQSLEQQKLAEQQREFNNPRTTLSPSEQKAMYDLQQQQSTVQAVQGLTGELSKVTGRDGYVSPQDYGKAKQAWNSQGFDPTKFDAYFARFRNPQNKYYPVDKSGIASMTNAGL